MRPSPPGATAFVGRCAPRLAAGGSPTAVRAVVVGASYAVVGNVASAGGQSASTTRSSRRPVCTLRLASAATSVSATPTVTAKAPRFDVRLCRRFHATADSCAVVKDPYMLLGIKRDASAADIKKAYYAAAKKFHPDTNKDKGAHDNFVRIQEAYDTLSDETKRAIFDGSRSGAPSGFSYAGEAFGGGFSRQSGYADFDAYVDEEEMYNIFEGRRRGNGPWRRRGGKGTDVRISVQVEFLDAIHGKTITVDVPRTSMCVACKGEGARFGAKRKECVRCDGTGTISRTYGSMLMNTPCTKCNGSGGRISREDRCAVCNGNGEIEEVAATEIKIPPGTTDETEIRIPGEGNRAPGRNGQSGDLRVSITVRPSDVFRRKGYDIYVSTEVPLTTAVLGGYVRVPTLDGDVEMIVRPGAQSGHIAVLRDRGIKKARSARGNARGQQYVTINVALPAKLTPRQRELFELLAAEERDPGSTTGNPGSTKRTSSSSSPSPSAASKSERNSSEANDGTFRSTFEKGPSRQSARTDSSGQQGQPREKDGKNPKKEQSARGLSGDEKARRKLERHLEAVKAEIRRQAKEVHRKADRTAAKLKAETARNAAG